MDQDPFFALSTGEAVVATAVVVAVATLVLLIVWQVFAIARRGMELRSGEPPGPTAHGHDRPRHDDAG